MGRCVIFLDVEGNVKVVIFLAKEFVSFCKANVEFDRFYFD